MIYFIIIIHSIGALSAYCMDRYYTTRVSKIRTWGDVAFAALFSICFSWIWFIVNTILAITLIDKKPPKWL